MKEQILALLRAARQRITPRNQWTQGYWAYTWAGTKCDAIDPNAICWCSAAALNREAHDHDWDQQIVLSALDVLDRFIPGPPQDNVNVFDYNDMSDHATVLAWFDRAIAWQEARP